MTNIVIILIGLFSILGGLLNWDWFMNNWRARFFVNILGRNGARLFYVGLGMFLIVVGII
ncbi:MAG: immunity 17 family protein [Chloroflexota bacterium]